MKVNEKHLQVTKYSREPFNDESFYNERNKKKTIPHQIWELPEFSDDDSFDSINDNERKYRSAPIERDRLKKTK
jgi:hypothetical protein